MAERGSEQVIGHPPSEPEALRNIGRARGRERPERLREHPRGWRPGRRRIGLVLLLLFGTVLVAATALAAWALLTGADEQPVAGAPVPDDDAASGPEPRLDTAPVQGHWRDLPGAPLEERTEQGAVWAGDRLLVWGGVLDDGFSRRVFHADGASLDSSGVWSPLPAAPLAPRTGHVAVWTGAEVLIWGGEGSAGYFADGAAFNFEEGTWRPLPEAPLSPRADAAALWTGKSLLLLGGRDNGGPLGDGAAFDPASGSWRPLPPLPETLQEVDALRGVWTGDAAVVWNPGQGGLAFPEIARFDWAADAWTLLPNPSGDEMGLPLVAWTGHELLAIAAAYDGTGARLFALPPGGQGWQERGAPPAIDDPWATSAWWTGQELLVVFGNGASAVRYDPAADLWGRLPDAPLREGLDRTSVWNGAELLILGGTIGGDASAASGAAWQFSGR